VAIVYLSQGNRTDWVLYVNFAPTETMTQYIQFPTADGGTILVEVDAKE
jgi:hypothetical protein